MNHSFDMDDKLEFFDMTIRVIEAKLEDLKKILDSLSQMREQVAYMQSDLMAVIDAQTWENVAQLIGLTRISYIDLGEKKL
ncbi:jg18701 [Pararge aegeria aegeria]|uniref:Jg18701 protein n=1 Tax=Pararge aegeria aegeria TaxID=348720 RepID=A0A8S4S175_9NEOP|nr:jg18701 [Pararge aegeria aegeria]